MNVDIVQIDGHNNNPPPSQPNKNIFVDRRKNSNVLLMILAGYKSFLYEDVFARVKAYTPNHFDVCIMSSGLFDEALNKIAAKNNWSYLSTTENNISLIQNLTIMLHSQAEWLFKMDEDIFITEGVFETLLKTYDHIKNYEHYPDIGFVAPLIPINSYGCVRLLDKLGLLETYEKNFEKAFYGSAYFQMLVNNLEVSKFFWGEGGFIPSIDAMNDAFRIQKMSYSMCTIRFNIGFILFRRGFWKGMGGWKMPPSNSYGGAVDEFQICEMCVSNFHAMVIAENAVVGHLCFGTQTAAMKEYYLTHREKFRCPK